MCLIKAFIWSTKYNSIAFSMFLCPILRRLLFLLLLLKLLPLLLKLLNIAHALGNVIRKCHAKEEITEKSYSGLGIATGLYQIMWDSWHIKRLDCCRWNVIHYRLVYIRWNLIRNNNIPIYFIRTPDTVKSSKEAQNILHEGISVGF